MKLLKTSTLKSGDRLNLIEAYKPQGLNMGWMHGPYGLWLYTNDQPVCLGWHLTKTQGMAAFQTKLLEDTK